MEGDPWFEWKRWLGLSHVDPKELEWGGRGGEDSGLNVAWGEGGLSHEFDGGGRKGVERNEP